MSLTRKGLSTLNHLLAETPRLETARGNYVLFEHELDARQPKRLLLVGKVTLRAIRVVELDLGEPTDKSDASWLADVLVDPYLRPFSARCLRAAEAGEIAFDDALVKE